MSHTGDTRRVGIGQVKANSRSVILGFDLKGTCRDADKQYPELPQQPSRLRLEATRRGFLNLKLRWTESSQLGWVDCRTMFSFAQTEVPASNKRLSPLARQFPNSTYIDFHSLICSGGVCTWSGDGKARLCFSLHGRLTAPGNTIVTRIRFKSSDGDLLRSEGGLSFSKEAGAYFYPLKQAREGRVQAQIAPPPGTSEIQICQQHWRRSIDRFEYSDLTLDRVVAFQGSASPSRASLTVLSLLDEFSQACWTPELNLQPLSRERPIEQIEAATSNCLFMESAWPSTASLADICRPSSARNDFRRPQVLVTPARNRPPTWSRI